MERVVRFLVVEFPSEQFIFTRFTTAHPLSVIDVILAPSHMAGDGEGDRIHPTVFMVKAVAWREMQGLLDELARTHGPPEILGRDETGLKWLCRVDFQEAALGSDATALRQFQDRFGPPWLHHENGILHMRAQLGDTVDADLLVKQLKGFLDHTGVEAQVAVQQLAPHDYSAWQELLEIGARLYS